MYRVVKVYKKCRKYIKIKQIKFLFLLSYIIIFQVMWSKIEGTTVIFVILDFCNFLSRFGHCDPTCDTFLESLGPQGYNRTIIKIF